MTLENIKKVYFIGIGGSSMSSLAEILKLRGYNVSGSDMQDSYTTQHLRKLDVHVNIGHDEKNIESYNPDIVIKTDAIMPSNPELQYAQKNNIKVYRRAELLGYILDGYKNAVGVAGTHGKTTTTSMITSIFLTAKKDTSSIIGGHMKRIDSSYLVGKTNENCIFESCEFKDSFLNFKPSVSVVLNIAQDHMEYFKTVENLINSFVKYLHNTRSNGVVIYNAEDENSNKMISEYTGKSISFGINKGTFTSDNIVLQKGLPEFDILYKGELFSHVKLSIPGRHNVKNALAAAAACYVLGISADNIANGLHDYNGTARRFEYHCMINGAIVADDYGHHPDAYKVTFQTARDLGFKRIIAIHQPHTFSRTKMLMDQFVEVLSTVDKVLIPPIYPARETNDAYHIYAQDVVDRLDNAEYMEDFDAIADRIKELAQPGDLFITLGCGDIYRAAVLTAKKYGEKLF